MYISFVCFACVFENACARVRIRIRQRCSLAGNLHAILSCIHLFCQSDFHLRPHPSYPRCIHLLPRLVTGQNPAHKKITHPTVSVPSEQRKIFSHSCFFSSFQYLLASPIAFFRACSGTSFPTHTKILSPQSSTRIFAESSIERLNPSSASLVSPFTSFPSSSDNGTSLCGTTCPSQKNNQIAEDNTP